MLFYIILYYTILVFLHKDLYKTRKRGRCAHGGQTAKAQGILEKRTQNTYAAGDSTALYSGPIELPRWEPLSLWIFFCFCFFISFWPVAQRNAQAQWAATPSTCFLRVFIVFGRWHSALPLEHTRTPTCTKLKESKSKMSKFLNNLAIKPMRAAKCAPSAWGSRAEA